MSKAKKLIFNTLIFGLGTFGSKLLQYLLLPLYTSLLSTYEYGVIDNLQNIVFLCVPIVSLTISESIFRFTMDKNFTKKEVLSTGIEISIKGSIFFFPLCLVFSLIYPNPYTFIIYIYVIVILFRNNFSQYVRARGEVKLYSIDNIVQTLAILLLNIYFLVYLKTGINGYIYAYIFGNAISLIFLFFTGELYKDISFSKDEILKKRMLSFSIPLIPNTICWWISNCSDRFMITWILGSSINGLYAIANKIPTVLTVLVNVFLQAWQISANDESENTNISIYYSQLYSYISSMLSIMSIVICTFSNLIIKVMTSEEFASSWMYIPILTLSVVFFTKAQFLGTIYTTFKDTKMAFYTNLIAAILNIIGNLLLIPELGGIGAAISTAFSYLVLWLTRQINVKRYIEFKYNLKREIVLFIFLILNVMVVHLFLGNFGLLINLFILFLVIFIIKGDVICILSRVKK